MSGSTSLLEGMRIVDMTTILFGPTCTQLLADLGADVIKVEGRDGDPIRKSGTPAKTAGMGSVHLTVNRGKRSLVLDLKDKGDARIMRDLLATADVFIHNIRQAAVARLGFDHEAVRRIKPDMVYVHCVGYGSDGPYSGRKAIDDVVQAASGFTSLPGIMSEDPTPRYAGSALADKIGGLHASNAVLAAIVHRLRTGEGQHVEVPMFEAFTHFFLQEHLFDATCQPPTGTIGYTRQLERRRRPFPTRDGFVAIAPYSDAEWISLFEVLGDRSVVDNPEVHPAFDTPQKRYQNQGDLYDQVSRLTPNFTSAEIMECCEGAGIAAMEQTMFADILSNPHLRAVNFFRQVEHPAEGRYLQIRNPVKFGSREVRDVRHAPLLGEHNDEIRAELARSQDRTEGA